MQDTPREGLGTLGLELRLGALGLPLGLGALQLGLGHPGSPQAQSLPHQGGSLPVPPKDDPHPSQPPRGGVSHHTHRFVEGFGLCPQHL